MTDDLDVLLIEDNSGDARLIEELLREGNDQLDRIDLDDSSPDRIRIDHASTLENGLERLSEAEFDVILLDLGLPDSRRRNTFRSVLDECEFTPVVVFTGLDDRDLGIDAIRSGAKDYLVKGEVTGDGIIRAIRHAIKQTQREREQARYREQLRSLNHLNRIGQDVAHAVITCSSREELEREVCERFVESDAYQFAWIGELHQPTGRLSPRIAAPSEDGDLDDAMIPIEYDDVVERPESEALRTRATSVARGIQSDPDYQPIRERLQVQSYRSIAAFPISYEGVFYGILALYADSATAFSDGQIEILERLCDTVGHAIAAMERRDALVEDAVLQLEFQADDVADPLVALTVEHECAVEFAGFIGTESGTLVYGRIEGSAAVEEEEEEEEAAGRTAFFEEVAAETEFFETFDVRAADDGELTFEATTPVPDSLIAAVAEHGGRLASATIRDGEFRFVVEFPSGRDKRQLVDLVEQQCPGSTIKAQRTVQRDVPEVPDSQSALLDRLTERQRETLETAFAAGYFDWPRANSGEEVAARLGISQATFSQHLRGAEKEIFAAMFAPDDESASGESNWESIRQGKDGD